MNITKHPEQVTIFGNQNCLISAAKQLTVEVMLPVKPLGVHSVDMTQAARQIAVWRLHQQVVNCKLG